MTPLKQYLTAACRLGLVRYLMDNGEEFAETDKIDYWAAAFWAGVKARETRADLDKVTRELEALKEARCLTTS